MKMDDEMLYNLVSNFSQVIDGVIHFTWSVKVICEMSNFVQRITYLECYFIKSYWPGIILLVSPWGYTNVDGFFMHIWIVMEIGAVFHNVYMEHVI